MCSSSNTYEIMLGRHIDLKKACKKIEVFAQLPVAVFAFYKDCAITVYESGRIVVKGAKDIKALAEELDGLLKD